MSFFGSNNNQQQQGTGFGGFGSSNNNATSGFGQPATSSSTFGGSTLANSSNPSSGFGGFGSGGSTGFGSNSTNNAPFGQSRPAFGSTTTTSGGGLFGGTPATTGATGGFGGFGSTNNNNNNNNTTGGSLFGSASKPAFGGNTAGGGLFGSASTGGFGASNNQQTTSAFGAPISSALSQNNTECQGTGSTPFSAHTEKEGSSSMTNHFQSISFMAPYQNFSFEELRLADYNQGRRFGNASGQAGAFGTPNFSSGFGQAQSATGAFGQTATAGSLFGQTPASSSGFGTTPAQSGFGSTSGGLFAQKPGGIFGNTGTSSQPSGGLFSTTTNNNNQGSGFGTSAGAFGGGTGNSFGQGNQAQQQQNKGFSFGNAGATTGGFGTGTTGFGSNNNNNNSGGSLFGQPNQGNNAFGQPQQQQNQNAGAFSGGFGQQPQNQNNTGSIFGQTNQEQKPGGIFGNPQPATNTSNLFGNQNTPQQGAAGGIFGQGNNNQVGTSLFNKPATGGGMFGQTNTTANTGANLFSNTSNQNQQNQGGGIFGSLGNNQQQKPGGLFGNPTPNTGGSLFNTPGNNNQQTGGGLFNLGGSNNQPQQQQSGSLFGNTTNNNNGTSLFGNQPQQQQPQPQQQNAFQPAMSLTTSILDPNAFGSPSIFSGLPPPPPSVTGPMATPISQKNKAKKNAILPRYKMTPSSSLLQTPQRRGFGFSYSTYGTPGSVASNASTPGGLSSSLMYGSVSRNLGLGKSLSTSNLRRNYDDAESILTPGAFSANSSRYGGAGSMKKLTIDRTLRVDLFGDRGAAATVSSPEKERQPSILKKKVSFDASTVGGNGEQLNGAQLSNNGSESISSATPSAEEQGFLRSPRPLAKPKPGGVSFQPEMEQVRGNELAIVPEDETPEPAAAGTSSTPSPKPQEDQKAGEYWMKPSKAEIQKMSKDRQRHVPGFSVGRGGCGHVEFDQPVDLTLTPVDDIYGKIIVVELRSLTVYPDQSKKPAQGKGLNVPATLFLENSWPRQKDRKTPLHEKSGPRFNKHVERLRKVGGTTFVRYEKDTGIWVFKVPHFTTYGFDYEDDASEAGSLHTSMLSEPPDTPTPKSRASSNAPTPTTGALTQHSLASSNEFSHVNSSPDDTFAFRKRAPIPGGFDEPFVVDEEDDHEMQEVNDNDQSFLDKRLASSPSDSGEDEPSEMQNGENEVEDRSLVIQDEDIDMSMEMVGAFPIPEETVEPVFGTPGKGVFTMGGDWAEELQKTVSPKKQDRQALRETQGQVLENPGSDRGLTPGSNGQSKGSKPEFATSIDLMNSLFGRERARRDANQARQVTRGKGLKWPYSKKSKTHDDAESEMSGIERQWHDSYKPTWGPGSTLLYAIPGKVGNLPTTSTQPDDIMSHRKGVLVSEGKDIRFAKLVVPLNLITDNLTQQRAHTKFTLNRGIPMAQLQRTPFKDMALSVQPDSDYEKTVWTLASILFDDQDSEAYGVPASQATQYDHRIRKDRLIAFWEGLCEDPATKAADEATNAEERAIAYLSGNKVVDACDALVQGKDYRLATLIARIGGDQLVHEDINNQISEWRTLNVLSEMTEPIRALYALLAGNTCICEGTKPKAPEDRARTFVISERFKLDWRRAFGLRLFYAIKTSDPIEEAVKIFLGDLTSDEPAKPHPPFTAPATTAEHQREDLLWGLLKLYAASKNWLPIQSLAHIIAPTNASPHPSDVRLSFQLYHALSLRFPDTTNPAAADGLAITFADQLDAKGEWLWAIFATSHLSTPEARKQGIQYLLAQHAADITPPPFNAPDSISAATETWTTLTTELAIPTPWLYQALALHARAITQDHVAEVRYLISAGDWTSAHDVFRHVVGPRCVIQENWGVLHDLLNAFAPGKDQIGEWGLGGGVYEDFLVLVKGDSADVDVDADAARRLVEVLPGLARGAKIGTGEPAFEEMVALREIGDAVGRSVLRIGGGATQDEIDPATILKLPLTEDAYTRHSIELSWRYYRGVMGSRG